MSDAEVITRSGSPTITIPDSFTAVVAVDVVSGMALNPNASAPLNQLGKALASAAQTAAACGLAYSGVVATDVVTCKYAGPFQLSIGDWDAALADTSTTGLTPGVYYYVSASVAGKLTKTAPLGGNYVAPVGLALTTTTMLILPQVPKVTSS